MFAIGGSTLLHHPFLSCEFFLWPNTWGSQRKEVKILSNFQHTYSPKSVRESVANTRCIWGVMNCVPLAEPESSTPLIRRPRTGHDPSLLQLFIIIICLPKILLNFIAIMYLLSQVFALQDSSLSKHLLQNRLRAIKLWCSKILMIRSWFQPNALHPCQNVQDVWKAWGARQVDIQTGFWSRVWIIWTDLVSNIS
jgi:hypothetical protein